MEEFRLDRNYFKILTLEQADKELNDQYTLLYYNIKNESTLHLEFKAIIINVTTKTGKIIKLKVMIVDTIDWVKCRIQDKNGISPINNVLLLPTGNYITSIPCYITIFKMNPHYI